MKKSVTIKDIAKMAEVSHSVVSVVLSHSTSSTRVSEKLRKRILSLAEEYHYMPNLAARGFKLKKSYLIGIFFNGSCDFILMRMLEEARSICYEYGYDLILYPSTSLEMEKRSIESARSRNLDGVITVPFVSKEGNNLEGYRQFLKDGIPVVQLLYRISDEFDFVGRDYFTAGYDAMRILKEHGHHRVGVILYDIYQDEKLGRSSYVFYKGVKAAAEELNMALQLYPIPLPDRFKQNACEEIIREIITCPQTKRPTALISNSNTLLHKAYGVMIHSGSRLPDDISLLGCGEDLDTSRSLLPDLSILKTPFRSIVQTAVTKVIMPDSPESQGNPEFASPFYEGKTIKNIIQTKRIKIQKGNKS